MWYVNYTISGVRRSVCFYEDEEQAKHFAKLVSRDDIEANDYNLSVSTYVEQEDTREKIDIKVLNANLKEIVAKENALRAEIDKIIKEIEG